MSRHDIVNPGGDSQYTPPWIFEALNIEFDLDVCSPKGGLPWIPAKNHYSEEDDGLTSEWYGNVWMNPPYSKPDPWVRKFIEHEQGIALIHLSRSNWGQLLWSKAQAISDMPTWTKFVTINGKEKGIFMPTYLYAFGQANVEALNASNIGSVR